MYVIYFIFVSQIIQNSYFEFQKYTSHINILQIVFIVV